MWFVMGWPDRLKSQKSPLSPRIKKKYSNRGRPGGQDDNNRNINVMRFRKLWLRVKSVNFDFSAKSACTDDNGSNKPTPKSVALIGSEKSLVEHGVPKN